MKNIITIAILFFAVNVYSQNDYLILKGEVTDTNNVNLGGVEVSLYQDGKLIKAHVALLSTVFEFDSLAVDHVYQVHFNKKGYCYKIAEVNMKGTTAEKLTGTFPMHLSSSLFPITKKQGKKLSFMKAEPVAKASYDATEDVLVWDMEYIEAMKKKIKAALR